MIRILKFLLIPVFCLAAGCLRSPSERNLYSRPGISDAQWDRIRKECSYEAEKAIAAASPQTAISYSWNRVYNMCAELKGVKHVGVVSMPEEQWQSIFATCKKEAAATVPASAPSKARDEERDALEIACMKRLGVIFRDW